jgi:hypothetical protein
MLIRDTRLTPALARWLRESHDDGELELRVTIGSSLGIPLGSLYQMPGSTCALGHHIFVRRVDGSEPSETERLEITARLAAHAVEPLK